MRRRNGRLRAAIATSVSRTGLPPLPKIWSPLSSAATHTQQAPTSRYIDKIDLLSANCTRKNRTHSVGLYSCHDLSDLERD